MIFAWVFLTALAATGWIAAAYLRDERDRCARQRDAALELADELRGEREAAIVLAKEVMLDQREIGRNPGWRGFRLCHVPRHFDRNEFYAWLDLGPELRDRTTRGGSA